MTGVIATLFSLTIEGVIVIVCNHVRITETFVQVAGAVVGYCSRVVVVAVIIDIIIGFNAGFVLR